jgi:hypothetical protein
MLRKLLVLALPMVMSLPSTANADEIMEPYPAAPVAPQAGTRPVVAPRAPVMVAPQAPVMMQPMPAQPMVVVPPPPPMPEPPPQYQELPQQYYPPANYYAQPMYAPSPPVHVRTIEQPRYGLMTAGLVILGASWSINAVSGYLANEWRLAVPVAGPFMYAGVINNSDDFGTKAAVMGLVFDGLIETAGAAMFLAGALTHHQVRVLEHAKVTVVPTAGYAFGAATPGLAAFGRF